MKSECLLRHDMYSRKVHIYTALLNIPTSNKFGIFSSNFYQHHKFYNLLMSSPGKNVTYV